MSWEVFVRGIAFMMVFGGLEGVLGKRILYACSVGVVAVALALSDGSAAVAPASEYAILLAGALVGLLPGHGARDAIQYDGEPALYHWLRKLGDEQ